MKVAQKQASAPTKDSRTEPLPLLIDDAGLARQVQSAPTADEAWKLLGLPGGRDAASPDAVAALAAAVTALCATSDSIGKGLKAFGALEPDADVPEAWVSRMVELHLAELEQYWHLDELAYEGLQAGGWTATTPESAPLEEPARIAQRARWQAEHLRPKAPALWWDKLDHRLGWAVTGAPIETVREAGRALVEEATRRRFTNWQQTRGTR
jgi:hypothetical protein